MDSIIELYNEEGTAPAFNRRLARDVAFKYIFEWQYGEDEIFEGLSTLSEMDFRENDRLYIEKAFELTRSNIAEIDGLIRENSKGWKTERLSKVCLAALRLALCEMLYFEDIPSGVTINEIVEIIKRYDSPEAGSFANGILGTVQKNPEARE